MKTTQCEGSERYTFSRVIGERNISALFARKSTSCTSSERHFLHTVHGHGLATAPNGCCGRLRTVANTKTTLSEHDSNLQTSRVKRKPFGPSLRIREKRIPLQNWREKKPNDALLFLLFFFGGVLLSSLFFVVFVFFLIFVFSNI